MKSRYVDFLRDNEGRNYVWRVSCACIDGWDQDVYKRQEVDEDYIQSELDTVAETFTEDYETYYAE